MSDSSTSNGGGPIPRGERARERVLGTALEVLAAQGMRGFTMEAVAERAGASKATLYRRWASRGELLVDAMGATFQPLPLPARGDVRDDLIELLTRAEALLWEGSFAQLMAAFIDAAERDPALKGLHVEITRRRREPIRRVLLRARQRGQIPATADLELAVDMLAGPAFYRRFIAHRPVPSGAVAALVDHVLAALRAPIGTDAR